MGSFVAKNEEEAAEVETEEQKSGDEAEDVLKEEQKSGDETVPPTSSNVVQENVPSTASNCVRGSWYFLPYCKDIQQTLHHARGNTEPFPADHDCVLMWEEMDSEDKELWKDIAFVENTEKGCYLEGGELWEAPLEAAPKEDLCKNKVQSAFVLYFTNYRKMVKETYAKVPHLEMLKFAFEQWKTMPEKDLAVIGDAAAKLKAKWDETC